MSNSSVLEGEQLQATLAKHHTRADKKRWRMCKHLSNLTALRQHVQTTEVATLQTMRRTQNLVTGNDVLSKFSFNNLHESLLTRSEKEATGNVDNLLTIWISREIYDSTRELSSQLAELCEAVTTRGAQDLSSRAEFFKVHSICSRLDIDTYLAQKREEREVAMKKILTKSKGKRKRRIIGDDIIDSQLRSMNMRQCAMEIFFLDHMEKVKGIKAMAKRLSAEDR
jgi:hypothetical protein